MIRLIATDMDGTLLTTSKELPKDFNKIMRKMDEQGIVFVVASGRTYPDLAKIFEAYVDSNNMYFICSNGASIYHKRELIYSNKLVKQKLKLLISEIDKIPEIVPFFTSSDTFYIKKSNFDITSDSVDIELRNALFKSDMKISIIKDLDEINDDVFCLTIFDAIDSEINSFGYLKKFKTNFEIIPSGKSWLDIVNTNVNKGVAIKVLQNKLNITEDESMAFGDYLNDYELMETVSWSFAMKNGHPKLKSIAKYETEYTNDEFGVIETLKKHLFVK